MNIVPGRTVRWLGFYGVIILAWLAIFDMARGDGFICGPEQVRLLPLGGFWALFPMWSVMMAAMMLPTIIPLLRSYDDLPVAAGTGAIGWIGIVLGYGFVWGAGSAGFAGMQVLALNSGAIDLTGVLTSGWSAAALLMFAGIWQFSQTKTTCQTACLSPMQMLMTRFKPGFTGGFSMGLEVGIVCVGCCWAIMALAFVGGVMNLLWMGLATLFMVAEKLPDIGMRLRRPAGVVLCSAGIYMAFGAAGIT